MVDFAIHHDRTEFQIISLLLQAIQCGKQPWEIEIVMCWQIESGKGASDAYLDQRVGEQKIYYTASLMDGITVGNDHQQLVGQRNKETIKTKDQGRLCKG